MPKIKELNFKKSYAELQKIVEWFEQDGIDLEEGIKKYKEGSKIAQDLKQYLESVELVIKEMK